LGATHQALPGVGAYISGGSTMWLQLTIFLA
jgi:hypothetical protein